MSTIVFLCVLIFCFFDDFVLLNDDSELFDLFELIKSELIKFELIKLELIKLELIESELIELFFSFSERINCLSHVRWSEEDKSDFVEFSILLIKSELIKSELIKSELIKLELIKLELIKLELIKLELIKFELIKSELIELFFRKNELSFRRTLVRRR